MKRYRYYGFLAPVLFLNACASPPVHYYSLVAPPRGTITTEPPAPFLVDVLPVGIPSQNDQSQLVVRQGTTGAFVLDNERWTGPLDDEIRTALSSVLTQQLATQDVAGLPQTSGRPVLRIKLQLRRFDAWPGQRVQLDADWSLGFAHEAGSPRMICRGYLDEPAPGGYPEMVQAQQRLVAALASRIATDARAWARSRQAACVDLR
ncbi:PqiC family protein [Klebsiella pneumoniae]|uniref:PqiC family protein n=1 Tax=Enterobacteriaceae TaxID=543 RepID=UPI00115B5AD7|nr:PqiC family protein [Klebsiella pneumoniae]ELY2785163.1 membrane integrity-associated transporter subunit PqiC [Cronobacter turicensis]ELA0994035.1 membrane integrity-associated transporter subunit PqiC [Klebsiella pneumoniae]MCU8675178.1 PqiC family protein [Klebsiella pneumoniae]MCU8688537.1 PqiC family protein [Klebsiella pneumoniae]HBR3463636.1 membrane integrity-associated transporter subunit PqiC [Klebsiella pneumoniae]